jgi:hypothetical protein
MRARRSAVAAEPTLLRRLAKHSEQSGRLHSGRGAQRAQRKRQAATLVGCTVSLLGGNINAAPGSGSWGGVRRRAPRQGITKAVCGGSSAPERASAVNAARGAHKQLQRGWAGTATHKGPRKAKGSPRSLNRTRGRKARASMRPRRAALRRAPLSAHRQREQLLGSQLSHAADRAGRRPRAAASGRDADKAPAERARGGLGVGAAANGNKPSRVGGGEWGERRGPARCGKGGPCRRPQRAGALRSGSR